MASQVILYKKINVLDNLDLQAYNDSIQQFGPRAREVLGKLEGSREQPTGSNPFMLVHLLNQGLVPGERLAERPDLEKAVAYDPQFVAGNLVDFGIALKTPGDSYRKNDLLAGTLAEQLKQRGISLGSGKLIPYNALRNRQHDESAYGLVLDLNETAEAAHIRDLSEFRWDYTIGEGMARAYLYGDRVWYYDDVGLDISGSSARVVVVSGEATEKNFDELSANLEAQRKKLETRLDQVRRAQAILRGE